MSVQPFTEVTHQFLLNAAVLLHQHGTPAHRLEQVMTKVSRSLDVVGVFLYTPTALIVSFASNDETEERTYLRRVDSGAVDADKLIRFDEVLGRVERGELSLADATSQLEAVGASPPLYPGWLTAVACGISCGAVATLFGGSAVEIGTSAAIGLGGAGLASLHQRLAWQRGFLEPMIGFLAAIAALAIAHWVTPMDDRLVTLAALIVFLPGLQLTVGLTELAVGHLSAGSARLAGAATTLLILLIGVAIGWRIGGAWRNLPAPPIASVPQWWPWLAILIAPITFAIVFRARWQLWPIIVAVSAAGFTSARLVSGDWGVEVGSFVGALVVGCGSNLYARLRDRPALVPLTPGIIVLVPGSLGYRSLAALLDDNTLQGIDLAFDMMIVGMALVGGVLMANAVISPKRIL